MAFYLGKTRGWALQMLWTTWGQLRSILSRFLARAAVAASIPGRSQVQPEPNHVEPRLTGTCGKERTGFPQAGGAYLSEIPHPVDPEIWKRCYTLKFAANCGVYWDRLV